MIRLIGAESISSCWKEVKVYARPALIAAALVVVAMFLGKGPVWP